MTPWVPSDPAGCGERRQPADEQVDPELEPLVQSAEKRRSTAPRLCGNRSSGNESTHGRNIPMI